MEMAKQPLMNRAVLILVGLGMAGIFVSSFVYRLSNPSIEMRAVQQTQTQSEMGEIGQLMARLESNTQDKDAMQRLGQLFMQMGAFDRAATFWGKILELDAEDILANYMSGICSFELEKYQEAAAFFSRVVALDPKDARALYNLGVLYKHENFLNDSQRAREYFQQAIDKAQDKALAEQAQKELDSL